MTCVSTVNYSMVVNGKPKKNYKCTQGLKQGDPLAPYLFLIFIEELSSLINNSKQKWEIKGTAVTTGGEA